MQQGFLKTAAATPKVRVADCIYNAEQIIAMIQTASHQGAKILVFPELSITSYSCGDLFFQTALQAKAKSALQEIISSSKLLDILCVVGLPLALDSALYNCAAVFHKGKLLGIIPKSNTPNYGEFYEHRNFTPAPSENRMIELFGKSVPFGAKLLFACPQVPQLKIGVEICEDLWVPCPPSVSHTIAGATVILNPSASDELVGKRDYRRQLIAEQSARLICGYVYANAGEGESTTDLVFAGGNLIAENGVVLAEEAAYHTGLTITELDLERLSCERQRMNTYSDSSGQNGYETIRFDLEMERTALTRPVARYPFIPGDMAQRESCCEEILAIQAHGLRKRMEHSRAKTAVVGISGGLDSCLALLVAVKAMDLMERPHTDVVAVTMPCFGTTSRTKSNAERLSEKLGASLRIVDIAEAVKVHFEDIGQDAENLDVVYENAQARERTQVLMDIANQSGGLVVGTGDLSELALGWATYNGDHMSMYGVNASIPKTLIRHIVRFAADRSGGELADVLQDILDTPVSPELLPAKDGEISQRTEDLVGPYALHDFFLYYAVRWGFAPTKVFRLARYAFRDEYDMKTILYWEKNFYRRFFAQQFKRSCLPDGPKVGSVSLSPRGDWRMPSDASAQVWLDELQVIEENL